MKQPRRIRKKRTRRPAPMGPAEELNVQIESLGAQGDGIARIEDRLFFVPNTAPGDEVSIAVGPKRGDGFSATVLKTHQSGNARTEPFCPHFGACGGCALQHVADDLYLDWKRTVVVDALRRRGLNDVPVGETVCVPRASRRRATFSFDKRGGVLGFNARFSHRVVDVEHCALLVPELDAMITPLRRLLLKLGLAKASVMLTRADSGLDVVIVAKEDLGLAEREALAAFAEAQDLARLSWMREGGKSAEAVSWRRHVRVTFGDTAVDVPSGGFLQPSTEGEAALVARIMAHMVGASKIADLFAGLGTFSFPLAKKALVHAVEGESFMTQAMETSAGHAGLGGRLSAEARDLERRPLTPKDLAKFDAVVFDPPRAGARNQAEFLAGAKSVTRIVGVSCNPQTFVRDARILVDGGFTLSGVTPIDQFAYSPHVEIVGTFVR